MHTHTHMAIVSVARLADSTSQCNYYWHKVQWLKFAALGFIQSRKCTRLTSHRYLYKSSMRRIARNYCGSDGNGVRWQTKPICPPPTYYLMALTRDRLRFYRNVFERECAERRAKKGKATNSPTKTPIDRAVAPK